MNLKNHCADWSHQRFYNRVVTSWNERVDPSQQWDTISDQQKVIHTANYVLSVMYDLLEQEN